MSTWGGIPAAVAGDFDYCRQVVKSHPENFPVGSMLAPKSIRHHLHAVYAFARLADDFADMPGHSDDDKLQLLDDWDRRLEAATEGRADHPVFRALAHTLEETELPPELLRNLLVAFRMDVTNKRYDTIEQLDDYCRFSANPVGRIVLHLAGETDPELLPYSDAICTALQLTNHWQDLGQDPWKGRPLYIPREEMARFGVEESMILQRRFSAAAAEMMLSLTAETRALFDNGLPLLERVAWPLNMELAVTWEGGVAILERIEAMGGNTLRSRPSLDGAAKIRCLFNAVRRVASL
ncbi:squalene synthase HpnC [Magnetofaba australis]|uniref:Putative squalene/phytoene synthase n=1 Tax=Magnetofaba australis IT-1 TaxID=1434232 RepID=A0A1Y2K302_9PROT|nr:squalene synthase HpnC [Magnetofaba australis]OSM01544.1 putative squalene/phytoene synthase [Magnetofaba australis IT-1]